MNHGKISLKVVDNFLLNFVDLMAVFAPAIFSIPILILYPSIESVSLVILGAVVGVLFYNILLFFDDIKRLQECLSGFIRPFSKCKFIEYQVDDFALHGSYALRWALDGQYVSLFGNRTRLEMKRDIKIYVVKKGASSVVPMQMATYESFYSAPSFIFVRDEPNRITPLGRFYIYHEVGHSSHENVTIRRFSHRGLKFFILPIFLAIFNFRPNALAYSILGINILLIILAFLVFKFVISRRARLIEEVDADLFAVSHLNYYLNEKLEYYLWMAGQLPQDSLLTKEQNLSRYNLLVENLRKLRIGSVEEAPSMKYSNQAVYYLSLLGIFIPVMGFLSRPPSVSTLCLIVAFIAVLISVWLWQSYKLYSLKNEIQGIIA